jgi:hypothetical protein
MKPGEVHARSRDQGGEPGDEVQRFEHHMGSAVSIRSFQPVADISLARQREAFDGEGRDRKRDA